MSKSLNTVLKWLDQAPVDQDMVITDLCLDSRHIKQGSAFIAVAGQHQHGIDFARQAQENGASVILSEPFNGTNQQQLTSINIAIIVIEQLSLKTTNIAAQFYDHPSQSLSIIGITGTNGKTSSAWLLLQAWQHMNIKAAYIGTLGYGQHNKMNSLSNTTPDALLMQKILAQFVKEDITHVAMEISSHGIALNRTHGLKLTGAALTNISRDHLDFHNSMDDYADTKRKLFTEFGAQFAVINLNDDHGQSWIEHLNNNVCSFAIDNPQAYLNAKHLSLTLQGAQFTVNHASDTHQLTTPLLAHFNVENTLLVVGVLLQQGHQWHDITPALQNFRPVPGRMNTLNKEPNKPLVIVDYAHTPDALQQVLMSIKQHQPHNIWCIFGCGGDRDSGKRPLMGAVVQQWADHAIITDDNPRTEDNKTIVADIIAGMNSDHATIIHDRQEAISYAVQKADQNDVVLIAGKGHEKTQQIGTEFHPFDDQIIASQALNQRGLCA